MRSRVVSIALVAALGLIVACGGGDESHESITSEARSAATTPAAPDESAPAGDDRRALLPPLPEPEPDAGWTDPAAPVESLDAYATLAAAVDAAPDAVEPRRRLARVMHGAGYRHASVPLFERNTKIAPDDAGVWLDLGVALTSIERLDEAAAAYDRLLELTREDPVALHNLGNVEYRRGNYERAVELYDAALALRPDYALALYHRGRALEDGGRPREAYPAYERVLDLEPEGPRAAAIQYEALYRMAELDLRHGAWARAADILAELVAVAPDHPRAHYDFARALTALGRTDEARAQLEIHAGLPDAVRPVNY